MIFTVVPYAPGPKRDLGGAINAMFERLRDDDWLFVIDHDMIPTTHFWYRQLEDAVAREPDGVFVPRFNRWPMGKTSWQLVEGVDQDNDSYFYHRQTGHEQAARWKHSPLLDVTLYESFPAGERTHFCGAFMMSRRQWRDVGPIKEGYNIDGWIHHRVRDRGLRVWCIRSLYLYHWCRGGGTGNGDHWSVALLPS